MELATDGRTRTRTSVRGVLLIGVLAGVSISPAIADAAKLKIAGKRIAVSSAGRAAVGLTNPNPSAAKGRLTLVSDGTVIARKRFQIPGRRRSAVRLQLTDDARYALELRGSLPTRATASAKRMGRTQKTLTLTSSRPDSQGGTGVAPETAGSAWQEGRYQGTYAENNADLAFNVVGTRLYTGPFDSFYVTATCRNVNPEYTGDQVTTDSTAIEPVEAAIASDGRFSGAGVYRPSPDMAMNWTLTGTLTGGEIGDGEFSVAYTDYHGNPCEGSARFSAAWYGDYTL